MDKIKHKVKVTVLDKNTVAGETKMPFSSETWDAISRYIYTDLQGGSIMKGGKKRQHYDYMLFR